MDASDAAAFCLSEAKLGLLPGTIAPKVVRAMGVQAFLGKRTPAWREA